MDDNNKIGEKLLGSLGRPILEDLEGAGLTRKKLIQKLQDELEAVEEKPFSFNGKIIYGKPVPNWEIRQRARIDALKLSGAYPKDVMFNEGELTISVIRYGGPEQIETKTQEPLEEQKNKPPVKAIDFGKKK